MKIIDFGLEDYEPVLNRQQSLFDELIQKKIYRQPFEEYVLLGEHPDVITMGRRAKESNVLLSTEILNRKGIKVYHIGRGGDVTYHCPGQLIVYPILDLEKHSLGVKDYVNILEETVIILLRNYGIKGERIEGATGVWIGKKTEKERKISAIGIKCSRYCTMHGLSLNVTSDLKGFSMINPCGFQDKGVTSIENEIKDHRKLGLKEESNFGKESIINKVKEDFLHIFFGLIFPFEEVLDFSKQLGSENEIV